MRPCSKIRKNTFPFLGSLSFNLSQCCDIVLFFIFYLLFLFLVEIVLFLVLFLVLFTLLWAQGYLLSSEDLTGTPTTQHAGMGLYPGSCWGGGPWKPLGRQGGWCGSPQQGTCPREVGRQRQAKPHMSRGSNPPDHALLSH